MSESFTVVHVLHPRFRDTDAMGHINNAVYITYLEVGRQEYWKALENLTDYRRVPFILKRPLNAGYAERAARGNLRNFHIFDFVINGVAA